MLVRLAFSIGLLFSLPCFSQAVTTPPSVKEVATFAALLQRAADVHPDATLNQREEDGAISALRLGPADAATFRSLAKAFNARIKQWRQSEQAIVARAGGSLADSHRAEIAQIVKERDQTVNSLAAQFLLAASREARANLQRIVDGN